MGGMGGMGQQHETPKIEIKTSKNADKHMSKSKHSDSSEASGNVKVHHHIHKHEHKHEGAAKGVHKKHAAEAERGFGGRRRRRRRMMENNIDQFIVRKCNNAMA